MRFAHLQDSSAIRKREEDSVEIRLRPLHNAACVLLLCLGLMVEASDEYSGLGILVQIPELFLRIELLSL